MIYIVLNTWICSNSVITCPENKFQIRNCDCISGERGMGSGYVTKGTQLYV